MEGISFRQGSCWLRDMKRIICFLIGHKYRHLNYKNMTGFRIMSTNKGILSNVCLRCGFRKVF
jgi:RNase P subunit RPR2